MSKVVKYKLRCLLSVLITASALNCGDYVSRSGKCYGPHTELVGWETAKATCQGENAQLVEVTDQAEQDTLHGKSVMERSIYV